MNNPAIVIVAYNRPKALHRLLKSIAQSEYPNKEITLHISIDEGGTQEVIQLAESFPWKFGKKVVEVHTAHLGLKKHIFTCGKLVNQYASIILLEDDLFVSPHFYTYAQKAKDFYSGDHRIAGISLYSYGIAESCHYPFYPIADDSDVYFMQVASSWGQLWTLDQWSGFEKWIEKNGEDKLDQLPQYVKEWGSHSWKKYFINYLIDTERYFVFPRESYSTNFEDAGTNARTSDLFQVELRGRKEQSFASLEDSNVRYDAWFELETNCVKRLQPNLEGFNFDVDLYGVKELTSLENSHVLTTRSGKNAERRFGAEMKPLLDNIRYSIEGSQIGLYKTENIHDLPVDSSVFFSQDLLKQAEENKQSLSLRVVIPVLEGYDPFRLKESLKSIESCGDMVECVLVSTKNLLQDVKADILDAHFSNVKLVSSESNVWFKSILYAFSTSRSDIVTWMHAGSVIHKGVTKKLHQVFSVFRQVDWSIGINGPLSSDENVNTAPYRFNSNIAETVTEEGVTELIFWRNGSFIQNLNNEGFATEKNLFMHCLKQQKLYTVAYCFGESQILKLLHSSRKSLALGFVSRLKYYYFLKNKSPWRILFVEQEHLPDVLRYDSKNDNFYFSRY